MKKIAVKTRPRGYAVHIENGLLPSLGGHLRKALGSPQARCFVVTTAPVRSAWGACLAQSLDAAGLSADLLEAPDGEPAKRLHTVERLAEEMVKRGADRTSVVLAFGGGVVGDMAGFLASIFMRGVDCVQVPTTLLAQVDAAIGGKTGVNLSAGKNLVGTFHQPRAVFVDPLLLSTLPEREFRAGLFEALKCGVIRNPKIFEFMQHNRERILAREPAALEWLVTECVRVKATVVAADERESGVRRILNFGHTIGHALEAETRYRDFLHGEAVGWGMVAAAWIGARTGTTPPAVAERITSAVLAYAPLPAVATRPAKLLARLAADKKTVNGVTHFILPRKIGQVEVVRSVPQAAILESLEQLRELSRG